MPDPDLEALVDSETWQKPAARDLTLWLVALAAPAGLLLRPAWAAAVAWQALTRRKRHHG
jgi:hypothetical protein